MKIELNRKLREIKLQTQLSEWVDGKQALYSLVVKLVKTERIPKR